MLKKKIFFAAFNFLMTKTKKHSKMTDVDYQKLEIHSFFKLDIGLNDDSSKWSGISQ